MKKSIEHKLKNTVKTIGGGVLIILVPISLMVIIWTSSWQPINGHAVNSLLTELVIIFVCYGIDKSTNYDKPSTLTPSKLAKAQQEFNNNHKELRTREDRK